MYKLRTWILSIALPIFIPLSTVVGGIWIAAIWTANQDARFMRVEDRVTIIEKTIVSTAEERRQIDKEIKNSLERLLIMVARLEALYDAKRKY